MTVTTTGTLNLGFSMAPGAPLPTFDPDAFLNRLNWQARAACGDQPPNVSFPERGASVLPALNVCRTCGVRPQCLEFAMADFFFTGIGAGPARGSGD